MTNDVVKLREITSAGVMECKKALEDAGGDFDKAVAFIHERGHKAEKKENARLERDYWNHISIMKEWAFWLNFDVKLILSRETRCSKNWPIIWRCISRQ